MAYERPKGPGAPWPPVEHRFKPGQSGNPSGKPKDPIALKKLRTLTKKELVEAASLVVKGDVEALEKIERNKGKKETVLRLMLASVCRHIINEGDMKKLDALLDRLVGKVKEHVLFEGNMDSNVKVIVSLPSNGREAQLEAPKIKFANCECCQETFERRGDETVCNPCIDMGLV